MLENIGSFTFGETKKNPGSRPKHVSWVVRYMGTLSLSVRGGTVIFCYLGSFLYLFHNQSSLQEISSVSGPLSVTARLIKLHHPIVRSSTWGEEPNIPTWI